MAANANVTTIPELIAAVRSWASANYPSLHSLEYVTIHLRYLPVPIQLAAGAEVPAAAATTTARDDTEERGKGLDECTRAILATLRQVGRPLSKTRLLEEMGTRGFDWSESTVVRRLAALMEDGTIENPEEARPRGYRLADEEPPNPEPSPTRRTP